MKKRVIETKKEEPKEDTLEDVVTKAEELLKATEGYNEKFFNPEVLPVGALTAFGIRKKKRRSHKKRKTSKKIYKQNKL